MADSVGNVVVFGIVGGILERLGSVALQQISQIIGVKDELKRLEKTLSAINGVLLDAEQQQSNDESLRNWLLNLKEVAYDIEDVLDLISTDLERQVNGASLRQKVIRICSHYSLARDLKAICCRLENIAHDRRSYNIQETRHHPPAVEPSTEVDTYSFAEESYIYGRKEERDWIVHYLITSSCGGVQQTRVVPIIGIGGMGKTTLAKMVINDPRVVESFELRIWAYISKQFDLKTAIVNIIQSASGENHSHLNMEALQKKLHDSLRSQTFLLVLDDVWIEDSKQWLQLKELLAVGAPRSSIIVTTREERVASLTRTGETYELKELSEDHCWSVFVKYAFNEREEDAYPLLVQIGKSIIRKCRGVPLAVKTLGSLLHHDRDYSSWKRIEVSELWKINQGPRDILPALKLSFDHTPHYLRLCFASCAIFKKGYPLHRSDLISIWMAQGLLQSVEGSEDAIDVGCRYFNELLLRSFFQLPGYSITTKHAILLAEHFNWLHGWVNHSQVCEEDAISQGFRSCDGKVTSVEMHDLVHDLAAYVAGEETTAVSSKCDKVSPRIKHFVWDSEDLTGKDFPKSILEAKKARTFAILKPKGIGKAFLHTIISNFRCLRILICIHSDSEELPDSIGNLKHLRYLDLGGSSQLKFLPRSICKLFNLEVLDVGGCRHLEALPKDVHKLVKLRIFKLTFLSTWLPKRGLQGWSSLQVLKIIYCPNLESLSDEFGSLKSLRILVIRICDGLVQLPNNMKELTNLELITIHSCKKLDLTRWEGLCDLRGLRSLIIYNLPKLTQFPDGIDSAAASLQNLRISKCGTLRLLPESLRHCTCLLKLQLFECPMLTSLPSGIAGLSTLQELRILGCPDLSLICERDTGHHWQLISHIPEIYIDDKVVQSRDNSTLPGQSGSCANIVSFLSFGKSSMSLSCSPQALSLLPILQAHSDSQIAGYS